MLNISNKKQQGKTAAPIALLLTTLLVASSSLLHTNVLSLSGDDNNNNNNLIYAQTSKSNATSTTPPVLPGVKITSPTRGQQIPIGNTNNSVLTIKGVSTSNTNSPCGVYIIIDGIKPYQKTLPTGQRGPNDYSTWKYQLDNGSAAIKPGSNKLTSKISCAANPANFSKSYSINVTGIAASTGAFSSSPSKQLQPKTAKTITISNDKSNNNNSNLTQDNSTNINGTSSSLLIKKHDQQEQQPSTISQRQTHATPSIGTVNDSRNGADSVSNNSGTTSMPEIKITSPAKGQQVPAGKDLLVSGTSASNATSPDCKVSVKVNGISPYHDVSANGAGGKDDYSKWNFTLTPAYATISEGQNKITAKFSCSNNPSIVSRNSVNVTGVSTNANTPTATTEAGTQQQQKFSSENNNPTPSVLPLSSPNLKLLSVLTNITKNPIIRGDSQIITITTSDGISNERVIGAIVDGMVLDTTGLTDKEFRNTTDANGQVSYSWPINKATKPGLFVVQYNVTADGFKPNSATSSFKVQAEGGGVGSSSGSSSSNNDHHHNSSTAGEGNSRHFNKDKTNDKRVTGNTGDNGNQGDGGVPGGGAPGGKS